MAKRYARDVERAKARIAAVRSEKVRTTRGTVEYAVQGNGQAVLMSHGIFGSHVEALGMIATYYGDQALAIAPSRYGYFGSSLPPGATPAAQADSYAELLDHLGVERVVAIGFSAGGPSIIEFGLRHPDRVELLVLLSSALPQKPIPVAVTRLVPPLMRAALSSDRPMWTFKTLMPGAFRRLIGVPKGFHPSASEMDVINEIADSMLPVKPRRDGAVFDAFTGNPYVNTCPLEEIAVPSLLVHAIDDGMAPYKTALDAIARMPKTRFVSLEGGHEFLGQEAAVRDAIRSSLSEAHTVSRSPAAPSGAVA